MPKMVSARSVYALLAVLLTAQLVLSADTKTPKEDKHADAKDEGRDTEFDACDTSTDDRNITQAGVGLIWENSNDPNFYTAPGKGACGYNYTDESNVVCLKPGWVKSAHVNGCNSWVQVYLPETGVVTQGIVWDACGALENTTFGCNDIYVSKRMFQQLAGNQRKSALDAGRLPGQLQWRFTTEPCWACAAGMLGQYANGTKDDYTGEDSMGFTRCGRRSGGNRIVGAAADFICNQQVDSCDKVDTIAKDLPKYKGKGNSTAATDQAAKKEHPASPGSTDSSKSTSGPTKGTKEKNQKRAEAPRKRNY